MHKGESSVLKSTNNEIVCRIVTDMIHSDYNFPDGSQISISDCPDYTP